MNLFSEEFNSRFSLWPDLLEELDETVIIHYDIV